MLELIVEATIPGTDKKRWRKGGMIKRMVSINDECEDSNGPIPPEMRKIIVGLVEDRVNRNEKGTIGSGSTLCLERLRGVLDQFCTAREYARGQNLRQRHFCDPLVNHGTHARARPQNRLDRHRLSTLAKQSAISDRQVVLEGTNG